MKLNKVSTVISTKLVFYTSKKERNSWISKMEKGKVVWNAFSNEAQKFRIYPR